MAILLRPGSSRIHRDDAWKTSRYAFVPGQTHFGELCGFADDVVIGGVGFPMHPHRDMEISSIVTRGSQLHEDSSGGRQLVGPGTVQTMSAGTGIEHSEMNASETEPFQSYQIWVYPRAKGLPPRYGTFTFPLEAKRNAFVLALSPDERDGSALIGQEAFFSLAALDAGHTLRYAMHGNNSGVYIHCADGSVDIAGQRLEAGDAIGVYEVPDVTLTAARACELICVEVPMHRGIRV